MFPPRKVVWIMTLAGGVLAQSLCLNAHPLPRLPITTGRISASPPRLMPVGMQGGVCFPSNRRPTFDVSCVRRQ
jgi:hypothetical protein